MYVHLVLLMSLYIQTLVDPLRHTTAPTVPIPTLAATITFSIFTAATTAATTATTAATAAAAAIAITVASSTLLLATVATVTTVHSFCIHPLPMPSPVFHIL